MVSSMARGRLKLSLRPRLILTTDTDWDWDTDSDTPLLGMAMDSDTAMDSSTARGLLMLRPIPTSTPDIMVLVTLGTVSDSSMARGLLMLSLRPRLILTTLDTDMDLDTPDTSDMPDTLDMPDSDTAESSTANRLHQDLSVNHRLDLRQKMDCYQFEVPFTSAAVSVLLY